jgi:hypothetical protein
MLASHGLHSGPRQVLDPAKGLAVIGWQHLSKPN